MKILLVDDSKTMRNIQKRTLSTLPGAEFFEAGDGAEALHMTSTQSFDLILADWNMPNMDGITFLRQFRLTNQKIPVVMVTTEAEKSRVLDALKAGANNYVVKPFTPEVLLEKLQKTLAAAEKRQSAAAAPSPPQAAPTA